MTVAPGLTNSIVTNAGRPIAATRMSASRATEANATVREWQIVTVACRCSSSSAIGLPTMSLRPMTTARAPAIGDARALEQLDDAGGRARRPASAGSGRAGRRSSDESRRRPFLVEIASKTCRSASAPIASGSGDCTRMPSCASLRLSRADDREQMVERRGRRQPFEVSAQAGSRRPTSLCLERRSPSRIVADEHDARPGGRPGRAVKAATAGGLRRESGRRRRRRRASARHDQRPVQPEPRGQRLGPLAQRAVAEAGGEVDTRPIAIQTIEPIPVLDRQ